MTNLRESPYLTSTELSNDINKIINMPVSPSCVRKNLFRIGLRSYAARKKPYINNSAMRKRVTWCKLHKDLPKEYWRNVLFLDETTIEIHPYNAMNRVRRFSFENPFQKNIFHQNRNIH